jgi:hypothetical protein
MTWAFQEAEWMQVTVASLPDRKTGKERLVRRKKNHLALHSKGDHVPESVTTSLSGGPRM